MRYLITMSYDGSKFNGFQRLKDNNSVQKSLEEALTTIDKSPVEIKGAGRTDRGVHAYAQKCHFELKNDVPANRLINAINSIVKPYIYVKDCEIVDNDFHARFNVKEKEYLYKINLGSYDPMMQDYTLQIDYPLNILKMKKASKQFLGIHNFSAFVSGKREDYTAEIKSIKFVNYGDILYIMVRGKSFYRYMVRNIIGALLEVGRGKIEEGIIKELLQSGNEEVTLPTARPEGLYLLDIKY